MSLTLCACGPQQQAHDTFVVAMVRCKLPHVKHGGIFFNVGDTVTIRPEAHDVEPYVARCAVNCFVFMYGIYLVHSNLS